MTSRQLAILALATAGFLLASGCDRAVTTATSERATWEYVEKYWGGIALEEASINESLVSIPFKLGVHGVERLDSGVCVHRITARFEGARIMMRIDKCICGPSATRDLRAILRRPASGNYDVVYDDATAAFPRIGRVTVP